MQTQHRIKIVFHLLITFISVVLILGVGSIVTGKYKTGAAFASAQGDYRYFSDMTGADVLHRLSEPGFIRREGDVTVWQYEYRDKSCILDIYFKDPQKDFDSMEVLHHEMRSRDLADPRSCG